MSIISNSVKERLKEYSGDLVILRPDQRKLIRKLCITCDMFEEMAYKFSEEIEILKEEVDNQKKMVEERNKILQGKISENERLKKGWEADVILTADAKAEAYKEFAERIHCHCQSIINQEWNKKVAPVSWADAYEQFDDETDNLLKELVGGK